MSTNEAWKSRWTSCGWVVGLLFIGVVSADNLVVNGSFDSGVSGWTVGYAPHGTLDYSDVDAQASPASGSALLTNISTSPWGSFWVHQCISVGTGEIDLGAQVMVPSGQSMNGNISVSAEWFGQISCEGSATSVVASPMLLPDVTDTWRWATLTSASPPPGTASARVNLHFTKEQDFGTLEVHFDNVYFGPAGGLGEIFSDGFESGDVTAWP